MITALDLNDTVCSANVITSKSGLPYSLVISLISTCLRVAYVTMSPFTIRVTEFTRVIG
jgi:hypothetical protein